MDMALESFYNTWHQLLLQVAYTALRNAAGAINVQQPANPSSINVPNGIHWTSIPPYGPGHSNIAAFTYRAKLASPNKGIIPRADSYLAGEFDAVADTYDLPFYFFIRMWSYSGSPAAQTAGIKDCVEIEATPIFKTNWTLSV